MPQSTFLVRNTHKETVKEQVLCVCGGGGGEGKGPHGESEIRIAMIQKKLGDFFFLDMRRRFCLDGALRKHNSCIGQCTFSE